MRPGLGSGLHLGLPHFGASQFAKARLGRAWPSLRLGATGVERMPGCRRAVACVRLLAGTPTPGTDRLSGRSCGRCRYRRDGGSKGDRRADQMPWSLPIGSIEPRLAAGGAMTSAERPPARCAGASVGSSAYLSPGAQASCHRCAARTIVAKPPSRSVCGALGGRRLSLDRARPPPVNA